MLPHHTSIRFCGRGLKIRHPNIKIHAEKKQLNRSSKSRRDKRGKKGKDHLTGKCGSMSINGVLTEQEGMNVFRHISGFSITGIIVCV